MAPFFMITVLHIYVVKNRNTFMYFEQVGLATGTGLAAVLFIGFEPFSSLFTTDSEVLKIALSGTLVRSFILILSKDV